MATPAEQKDYKLPVVVLVGRANVGKSSLFNRMLEEKKALVSDIAGTTRTNNEGDSLWRGTYIHMIDTGGPDNKENEPFAKDIIAQAKAAISQADIILFVGDAEAVILPQEHELARQLHRVASKSKTPIILVANKCDNQKLEANTRDHEWLSLGLGNAQCVSASNGRGVGDLLELIYAQLKKQRKTPKGKRPTANAIPISVCLLGKPNVGKSSLFNKLIGEEKVIVSDIAHTTREPFDTELIYEQDNKKYQMTFVDTAGIRRKARVSGVLELAMPAGNATLADYRQKLITNWAQRGTDGVEAEDGAVMERERRPEDIAAERERKIALLCDVSGLKRWSGLNIADQNVIAQRWLNGKASVFAGGNDFCGSRLNR